MPAVHLGVLTQPHGCAMCSLETFLYSRSLVSDVLLEDVVTNLDESNFTLQQFRNATDWTTSVWMLKV